MEAKQPDVLLLYLVDFTLAVEFLCGTAANCLLLVVFYRKPGLLTVANRFVVNLTIINIITCLSLLPLAIADNILSPLSNTVPYLCYISQFFSYFCASIIPFSILLIAVDQFYAVLNALHYHAVMNNVKSACMIVAAWTLSTLMSTIGLLQHELCRHEDGIFRFCSTLQGGSISTTALKESNTASWLSFGFNLSFVAVSFVVPFTLICFIYSKICSAASGNVKRTKPDLGHVPLQGSALSCTDSSKVTEREDVEWDEDDPGLQMNTKPSLVLTRPSPPRVELESTRRTCKSVLDINVNEQKCVVQRLILVNRSLPNLELGKPSDGDLSLMKPFLPRNTSFCVPMTSPALSIPQRRHSNVPIHQIDSDILPKLGSLYKQARRASSSRSSSSRLPVSRASSIRSTSSYLVNNLRHRLSNAGLFRYRERARVARVSALVIVMALLSWLPFFTVILLQAVKTVVSVGTLNVPPVVNSIAMALLLLSTVGSPALFAFRNRKIRKEIKNMFKFNANDIKTYSGDFSRQHFLMRVKGHMLQFVSKFRPKDIEKNVVTVVHVKPNKTLNQ